ncbi:hypothetical protein C8Q77DRAFT_837147 [Trametes polyzona]|nr:hypothetical protein C8Q77DRAFT_837147 [Trametes polyzona]
MSPGLLATEQDIPYESHDGRCRTTFSPDHTQNDARLVLGSSPSQGNVEPQLDVEDVHRETIPSPQGSSPFAAPEGTPAPSRVPTEVWLRIFGYTASTRQRSLTYIATLSREIGAAAVEALYRFPEIFGLWVARKFALTILQSPFHARLVRGLQVIGPKKETFRYTLALRSALPLLTRLSVIVIHTLGSGRYVDQYVALDILSSGVLPSLKRIRGLPLVLDPSLLSVLSTNVPRLEELSIDDYIPISDADTDTDEGSDHEDELPESDDIIRTLPQLRAFSCPGLIVEDLTICGNITALSITAAHRTSIKQAARLFGHQLLSLRVERELGTYVGMAFPTNWIDWKGFTRLKFLEVQDTGKRCGDKEGATIKTTNLPPNLETLVWGPTWALDCALIDGHSEFWRWTNMHAFTSAVLLSSPTVKSVVRRWSNNMSYQCFLVGEWPGVYREILADHSVEDPYAWANVR